ncbi:Hypothetical predicted protein [Mytilus galloprovincialis]|uniref:Peptidase A2 domain-containing protein n=1 Tax=Mytilus galloprovincialis TaxID=29158 RepID=A0A8B6BM84_MYTGA|nr:Hypothetical predicted protein [Mytilus galloprovincialis]
MLQRQYCKEACRVRQIETEEQYDHTELIGENEIRKEGISRFVTEKLEIFSREKKTECSAIENIRKGEISKLSTSLNKNQSYKKKFDETVCFSCLKRGHISKSKLSLAFEDTDKLYAVDNICGDEPGRSKLSVASGQFDDAEINISESSFVDEYVTVDITSVDVVIDRLRAVTLRVSIVIEGDYLKAVIETGAEVTVMSQEKFQIKDVLKTETVHHDKLKKYQSDDVPAWAAAVQKGITCHDMQSCNNCIIKSGNPYFLKLGTDTSCDATYKDQPYTVTEVVEAIIEIREDSGEFNVVDNSCQTEETFLTLRELKAEMNIMKGSN